MPKLRKVGEKVLIKKKRLGDKKGHWYEATVREVHKNGRYRLTYTVTIPDEKGVERPQRDVTGWMLKDVQESTKCCSNTNHGKKTKTPLKAKSEIGTGSYSRKKQLDDKPTYFVKNGRQYVDLGNLEGVSLKIPKKKNKGDCLPKRFTKMKEKTVSKHFRCKKKVKKRKKLVMERVSSASKSAQNHAKTKEVLTPERPMKKKKRSNQQTPKLLAYCPFSIDHFQHYQSQILERIQSIELQLETLKKKNT